MNDLEKSILAVLVYYDIFDHPLTAVEIFKYLPSNEAPSAEVGGALPLRDEAEPRTEGRQANHSSIDKSRWPSGALGQRVSFLTVKKALAESAGLAGLVKKQNGVYFLTGRDDLIAERNARMKIAQLKWRRFRRLVKYLALVPFLQLAAAIGSITAYNTTPASDLDLLVIMQTGRFWLARVLAAALTETLGARRHGRLIANRLCFNCYLTERSLNVENEARLHYFLSAQGYSRLMPLLENQTNTYERFISQNDWLKNQLNGFPWPMDQTAHRARRPWLSEKIRKGLETALGGRVGDWLERKTGEWQFKRINQKNSNNPSDEIYVDEQCLMFHPQAKSLETTRLFNTKMNRLIGHPTYAVSQN